MRYEGNFTEQDIRLMLEDLWQTTADIKVISRYKTAKGYMALILAYGQYNLCFTQQDYIAIVTAMLGKVSSYTELLAREEVLNVAKAIEAEKMH
jgi:hypothetical protein